MTMLMTLLCGQKSQKYKKNKVMTNEDKVRGLLRGFLKEGLITKSRLSELLLKIAQWKDKQFEKSCEWISTKESLPPLDKDVLVVLPKGEMTVARREKTYSTVYVERWVGAGNIIFLDELVYYWKELPVTPKTEK